MTATSSCTGNTTNFQYTIKVKNTGLFHALNTSVSETLPAGITLVSGTLNGAPIAGLTAATLASGIPLKSTNAVTDGQIFKGDSATIVLNCTAPSASATYTAQAFLRYNGIESLNLTNDRIPSNDPTTATVNDATSLTTVDCFIIDGTVFNDNNGTSGGADGSPLAGVTVTLYANDGITAIATSVTDASGHYSFPGLVHGDYIVGVTLPTGYRNVSSTDITPTNGQTAVTIGNLSVNGVNFGLNLPPTPVNDTLSTQIPGTVATVPNILSNDTDPNGGTLSTDSITLIAPPGATNIITDTQGDVTGFTVPGEGVWSLNSSNGTVTFSPQTGFTDDPTPISYTVTDIAGLSSPSATITIDYNPPVVVSGTVFNDANGGTIDGTPTNAGGLNAILVNAAGDVVATVPVNALGEYTFSKVIPGNFSVRLSTVTGTVGQPAPAASLPANWTNTAEGTTATGDNTVDGSISLTVSNTPLSNVNFGIERLPESYPVNYSPTGAPTLTILNAQPLQGSDPEDQLTQGSWSGKSLVIDTLPTNGYILRYNGVAVTAGTPIPNYNPALLTIAPGATSAGTGTTTFKYATIDAAGKKDPTPAAYTVTWSIPLPAQLLTFTGSASKDCGFILDWTSGKEEQLSHFAVERSKDGMVFETIATVTPTGSNSTYHYTDNQVKGRMQYYRLRIVDVDHKEAYSKVLSLSNECGHTLSIYPNPVQDKVRIEGLTAAQTLVQIFNAEGRLMVEQTVKATSTELNIADLADGVYHFVITSDGRSQTMKVIKRK
ncbi:hypothetical protein DBR32_10645 [Taibaiella sp. KBW10]|nr:hypothetical protein DBR32_10645 [Taibaiella sp. KBW10]